MKVKNEKKGSRTYQVTARWAAKEDGDALGIIKITDGASPWRKVSVLEFLEKLEEDRNPAIH